MKRCGGCARIQSDSEFSYRKDRGGPHTICRGCQRRYWREYYHRDKPFRAERRRANNAAYRDWNRRRLFDYLVAHGCVDCGESDPVVLEFDHVRGEKIRDVSTLVCSAISWQRIVAEIQKCDVRCANCHRRKTARERGWWSSGM